MNVFEFVARSIGGLMLLGSGIVIIGFGISTWEWVYQSPMARVLYLIASILIGGLFVVLSFVTFGLFDAGKDADTADTADTETPNVIRSDRRYYGPVTDASDAETIEVLHPGQPFIRSELGVSTITIPNDALVSQDWASLGVEGGAGSPYLDIICDIESCDDAVVLDLSAIDPNAISTIGVNFYNLLDRKYEGTERSCNADSENDGFGSSEDYLLRLELERSLGWFVDQLVVLQAASGLPFSLISSHAVERWLRSMSYAPWPSGKVPQEFELPDQAKYSFKLLSRWFEDEFPYKRDGFPDVIGLFLVGVAGGEWPLPDHDTFSWRFHVEPKSIELHWAFCTGNRMGDSGRRGIVRDGKSIDTDFDFGEPPFGWTLLAR